MSCYGIYDLEVVLLSYFLLNLYFLKILPSAKLMCLITALIHLVVQLNDRD